MNKFKKATVILLVFATLVSLTGFSSACTVTTETSDYVKTVSNFCKMKPEEIYNKIDEDKREEFLGAVKDTHQVLETIAKDILMVWNILNRGDRFSDTEIAEPVPSIPNLGFSNRLTKFTE